MDNSTDSSTSDGSENSSSGSEESTSESGTTNNSGDGDVNATATEYWYSHYEEFTISSYSTNEISTAGQLAYLAYMVNSGNTYSGYVFQLTADLDMSAYYWVPIGGHEYDCSATNTSYYFAGEFDGNSHTISGLDMSYADTSSSTYNHMGLFGFSRVGEEYISPSIHDIGIINSTIIGHSCVGAVLGDMDDYEYCVKVSNCYNTCNITGYGSLGGIVGSGYAGSISFCYNSGNVTGRAGTVGGIAGNTDNFGSITCCYNYGTITGTSSIGGITGFVGNYSSVGNCYNIGDVTGTSYVGGIAGGSSGYSCVNICYNMGSVTGTSGYVGGIVGSVGSCDYLEIGAYNCYNTGDVIGTSYVGGIVGYVDIYRYCCDCFNTGNVTGTTIYVGGILGYISYSSDSVLYGESLNLVSSCYYGNCIIIGEDSSVYQKGIGYINSTGLEGVDSTGETEYISGITLLARCSAWFTTSSNWYSSSSWNFSSRWGISADYNNGYPYLLAFGDYGSEDVLKYDENEDYWYFEDGYMPQSYYGATAPSGVSEVTSYLTINLTDSTWAEGLIYDDAYAYVTIYSDSSGEIASGWFNVEPIVWIVGYGSDVPTDFSCAVTAKIVTCGQATSSASANWSARRSTLVQSLQSLENSTTFSYATISSFAYDSFNGSTSQIAVTDDAVSATSLLTIASVEEIDALGGSYASTCTDFVAFLLSNGSSTDGDSYSADYWTRDLAAEVGSGSTYYSLYTTTFTYSGALNNGVYVTKDGTLSNAKLKTCMGARLTMSI